MLEVRDLVKYYGGATARRGRRAGASAGSRVLAVDGVSFEVKAGELFTLLGPSGCGKTTTLRSIAGLETPDGGLISVGGKPAYDSSQRVNVSVNRRGLGMVFQSYAIWPHMTVFQNVAFPLQVGPRAKRMGKAEAEKRVTETLEVTGLGAYAARPATNLSGGQQQRLALARAMVTRPSLMLLDEPLSNLDAKLRESMRIELQRLQRELGLTSVYVTHDQTEALVLSSRIAVMSEGKVMQIGTPDEIYRNPANQFVAEFVGVTNFVRATVVESSAGQTRLETEEGPLVVSSTTQYPAGTPLLVSIRPECMTLVTDMQASGPNLLDGAIVSRAFHGESTQYVVRVGGLQFKVRCEATRHVDIDDKVRVSFRPEEATVVPA